MSRLLARYTRHSLQQTIGVTICSVQTSNPQPLPMNRDRLWGLTLTSIFTHHSLPIANEITFHSSFFTYHPLPIVIGITFHVSFFTHNSLQISIGITFHFSFFTPNSLQLTIGITIRFVQMSNPQPLPMNRDRLWGLTLTSIFTHHSLPIANEITFHFSFFIFHSQNSQLTTPNSLLTTHPGLQNFSGVFSIEISMRRTSVYFSFKSVWV